MYLYIYIYVFICISVYIYIKMLNYIACSSDPNICTCRQTQDKLLESGNPSAGVRGKAMQWSAWLCRTCGVQPMLDAQHEWWDTCCYVCSHIKAELSSDVERFSHNRWYISMTRWCMKFDVLIQVCKFQFSSCFHVTLMLHIFGLRSRRMAPVPRASVQVRWNQQITRASCAEILELFQRNGSVSCSPEGPVMPSGCYPKMIVWTTRIGVSTWFQLQPETTRVINIRLHWHIFCLRWFVFFSYFSIYIGNFIIPTDYWNHLMTVEKLTEEVIVVIVVIV